MVLHAENSNCHMAQPVRPVTSHEGKGGVKLAEARGADKGGERPVRPEMGQTLCQPVQDEGEWPVRLVMGHTRPTSKRRRGVACETRDGADTRPARKN